MLQLQQRSLCQRRSSVLAVSISVTCCRPVAAPKRALGRTKRHELLAVHSGRGEEVVAFLPNDGTERNCKCRDVVVQNQQQRLAAHYCWPMQATTARCKQSVLHNGTVVLAICMLVEHTCCVV